MKDTIIQAKYIITSDAQNHVIKDGAVYIDKDRIIAVDTKSTIYKDYSSAREIIADHHILIPGLVNTHSHSVQTLLRGKADDLSLLDWLKKVVLPGEANFTGKEVYISSSLGFAEMIRTGTTTTNDMLTTHHTEEGIKAAIESGIRVRIGKMLMDVNNGFPDSMIESADEIIETVRKHIQLFHGSENGRIRYSLNARFLLSCSKNLMKMIVDLHNEEPDVMIHTHASESREEAKTVENFYGVSYIRALHQLDVLGTGTILAHGIWLDNEEYKLIKQTGTKISHNPTSNAKLASGICDVIKYKQMGIVVGLATDGAPCNNNLDMFREMRLAALIQKVKHLNERALPAHDVFKMATIEGAKALNLEHEIGSIEPSKKADLVLIDINGINAIPLYDPISHIVYSAYGKDVSTVIIDGKVVYDNGNFITLNVNRLRKEALKYQEKTVD